MKTKPVFCLPNLLLAATVALTFLLQSQARANTIALSFTSHVSNFSGLNNTVGWSFSLSSAVLVTDLGVFDGNFMDLGNGTGDGLSGSVSVTIWDDTTMTQLAQATVPSGTSATLVNGFRYVTLGSSVPLGPGNYVIGAFYNGVDAFAAGASGITTATGVSYTGGRFKSGGGNGFPETSGLSNGAFGPNFQFTAPLTNGVPEPGSTIALMLGAVGMIGAWRWKNGAIPARNVTHRVAGGS